MLDVLAVPGDSATSLADRAARSLAVLLAFSSILLCGGGNFRLKSVVRRCKGGLKET